MKLYNSVLLPALLASLVKYSTGECFICSDGTSTGFDASISLEGNPVTGDRFSTCGELLPYLPDVNAEQCADIQGITAKFCGCAGGFCSTLCPEGYSGFDSSLNTDCLDIEEYTPFIEDKETCDGIQQVSVMICGCTKIEEPCVGTDDKPYPDLDKVPSIGEDHVLFGEDIVDLNLQGLTCGELSTIINVDNEYDDWFSTCEIADAFCAENTDPCEVCPFGVSDPDKVVDAEGQSVITCGGAISQIEALTLTKDRCNEMQKGAVEYGCCKPDPNIVPCKPCFENGEGFDPTLTFQNPVESFQERECSAQLTNTQYTQEGDQFCTDIQMTSYLYCGCETAPPDMCLTDENGIPVEFADGVEKSHAHLQALYFIYDPKAATEEFSNDLCSEPCTLCVDGSSFDKSISLKDNPLFADSGLETCGDLEYILPFVKGDECNDLQFILGEFCGCSGGAGTPSCSICANDGSGFDPTISLVGNAIFSDSDFPPTTCGDFEDFLPFITNEQSCQEFQIGTGAFCGCSTLPDGAERCETGIDGKPFPDLEKLPDTDNVFFGGPYQGLNCGELSVYGTYASIYEDEYEGGIFTTCESAIALCTDGPTCEPCPFGLSNPDRIVPGQNFTCAVGYADIQKLTVTEEKCVELGQIATDSGCCNSAPAPTAAPVIPPTNAPVIPPTNAPDKKKKGGKKGKNQKKSKNSENSVYYGKKRNLADGIVKNIQNRKKILKGF